MSDSNQKTKTYCTNNGIHHHLLSGSGGFTSIANHHHHHNPLNISPLLTKSVSCFDPVLNQDLIFNGTNIMGNDRYAKNDDKNKMRKISDGT